MAADDGRQFCSVPNFLGSSGQCQWRKRDLTYSVTSSLGGLSDDAWLAAIKLAWSYWEEVCHIRATYTEDAVNADMLVAVGTIDGPSGVLAWSEMPCGASDPDMLNQRYDGSEQWVVAKNPPSGSLDIVRVACHEIGHLIGIPHFPQGAAALLAPTYSTKIRKPQPLDIQAAQDRYGPPIEVPVPPIPQPIPPVTPTPIPPGGSMNWLQLILQILALLGQLNPGTPTTPPTPGTPVPAVNWLDLLRRLLAKIAGGAITAEQFQQAFTALELHTVTQAEMNAPVQAMKL